MPAEKTRCDSLALYFTGASSDGGAQTDPDVSLGNYRSSTRLDSTGRIPGCGRRHRERRDKTP